MIQNDYHEGYFYNLCRDLINGKDVVQCHSIPILQNDVEIEYEFNLSSYFESSDKYFRLEKDFQDMCLSFLVNIGFTISKDYSSCPYKSCSMRYMVHGYGDYRQRGFPDLMILEEGKNRDILYIELKTPREGSKLEYHQKRVHKELINKGNNVFVIRRFREFIEALGEHFFGDKEVFFDRCLIEKLYLSNIKDYLFINNERDYLVCYDEKYYIFDCVHELKPATLFV